MAVLHSLLLDPWEPGQVMGNRGKKQPCLESLGRTRQSGTAAPENSMGLADLEGNEYERDRVDYCLRNPQLLSLLFLRTA